MSDGYIPRASPVAKSLNEARLLLGAPLKLTAVNGMITVVFVFGPGFLWWFGVTFIVQSILKWATKKDDQMFAIYMKYDKQADIYEPWVKRSQKVNLRPEGFGRDLLY